MSIMAKGSRTFGRNFQSIEEYFLSPMTAMTRNDLVASIFFSAARCRALTRNSETENGAVRNGHGPITILRRYQLLPSSTCMYDSKERQVRV